MVQTGVRANFTKSNVYYIHKNISSVRAEFSVSIHVYQGIFSSGFRVSSCWFVARLRWCLSLHWSIKRLPFLSTFPRFQVIIEVFILHGLREAMVHRFVTRLRHGRYAILHICRHAGRRRELGSYNRPWPPTNLIQQSWIHSGLLGACRESYPHRRKRFCLGAARVYGLTVWVGICGGTEKPKEYPFGKERREKGVCKSH